MFPIVLVSKDPCDNEFDLQQEASLLSPKDFLLRYPRGAYTTMRTVDVYSILELSMHISRLYHALNSLKFCDGWDKDESKQVTDMLSDLRTNFDLLDTWLRKSLCAIVKHYLASVGNSQTLELKITVLIYVNFEKKSPELVMCCDKMTTLSYELVTVEIQGTPRKDATSKDSQWVRDRDAMIKKRFETTHEVLLHRDLDIYEGMTSNFFVVRDNKLFTAPLDLVLPGTIQKLVFEVCESLGIELVFACPRYSEISDWQGAFLTSTSRIVLAISKIYTPNEKWIEIPSKICDMINNIREKVWVLMREKSETITNNR